MIESRIEYCAPAFEAMVRFPGAFIGGLKYRAAYDGVRTHCMFIGYPRSGHSLIGSLLDAHSNIAVAHELGTLKYLLARYSRRQLFHLIRQNSLKSARTGRRSGSYSYAVPSQYQGRSAELTVVGDNQGGGAVLRLTRRPWLLNRLQRVLGPHVKFIHVIRNPYDNISTIYRKAAIHRLESDIRSAIDYYFSLCRTILDLKDKIPAGDLFELRHENFIADPKVELRRLCRFLDVLCGERYLDSCAGIVYDSPHRSRFEVDWHSDLIDLVRSEAVNVPYLKGYSYDG